jgi:hypothetical protein
MFTPSFKRNNPLYVSDGRDRRYQGMADKVRRQKDLVTRTVDNYKNTTLKDYAKYFEGSPTYVMYYQLDSVATRQDTNLENVNNLLGANSPNKYKKIEDVVIYGVDALQISNEISEKGLQSLISGEFVLLPDSIRPYPGDFFVFDDSELQEHLFRVNDVQYDKASPRKFFRCSFSLYQDNSDLILGNVEGDYVMDYKSVGGEVGAVLKKEDSALSESVKKLVDGMIDKYNSLFYDEDMDTFAFVGTSVAGQSLMSLWSPYLQKFIHDHKVLEKYTDNFMTEIYVNDIGQKTNRGLFSDLAYFNSIFRKVEQQEMMSFENSFMAVDLAYNLKSTRNLPFFHSAGDYSALQVRADDSFYSGAFHLLFQNFDQTFGSSQEAYKFQEGSTIDTTGFSDGQIFYELSQSGSPIGVYRMFGSDPVDVGFSSTADIAGETLYNIVKNYLLNSYSNGSTISGTISGVTGSSGSYSYTLTVSGSPRITTGLKLEKVSGNGSLGTGAYISSISGSSITVVSTGQPASGTISFRILKSLNVTESLITEINSLFITSTLKNYVLIPLVLYVLKQGVQPTAP